jgi:hypothetical protein
VTVPIIDAPGLLSSANQVGQRRTPVFLSDGREGPDLLDTAGAIQPIAELCAHRDTQTPFMIAIVGPSGSGKSFALERLRRAVENVEAAPTGGADDALVTRMLTIPIDAAAISGDPVSAIAAAVFAALERGKAGVSYEAVADEAAHAGADPHQAAHKALERHDEARSKLEAERQSRDEVEARRARLVDNVLFEMAGSRIDAYARASRFQIDARLRRFDLAAGDSIANFKTLVRDVAEAGWGARIGVALTSIWSYRSQRRMLLAGIIFFLLAFGVGQAGTPRMTDWLRSLGAPFVPAADWIAGNSGLLGYVTAALVALGAVALIVNLLRAALFAGMLFRGARLLNYDVGERRRDLDAASARLNRRIVALTAEVDAAAKRAEAAEKRTSLGEAAATRAPAPPFVAPALAGPSAARAFLASLAKLLAPESERDPLASLAPAALSTRAIIAPQTSTSAPSVSAPERLVLTFDNLDALPPAQALGLIEAAHSLLGPSFVAAVACDPAALAPAAGGVEALRRRFDKLFQLTFNVRAPGASESARLIARLTGAEPVRTSRPTGRAPLSEPLTSAESTLLSALAGLAADTPRGVKRYLNAYRVARGGEANRPALALMLALDQSGDGDAVAGMDSLLTASDGALAEPPGPPALVAGVRATRAASGGELTVVEAIAAKEVARRYRLFA